MSNEKKDKTSKSEFKPKAAMQVTVIANAVVRPKTEDVKKPKGDKK